ncbi:MAG: type II secretion system F family protein [Candidatus Diapherotrites archaeon]|nr:type II secretion system F family protein [Candidatus Diapherotrites archaeon]
MSELYLRLGSLVPEKIENWIYTTSIYAGIQKDRRALAGQWMIRAGILAVIGCIVSGIIFQSILAAFLGLFVGFLLGLGLQWYLLDSKAEKRAKFTESVLPDALQLVASNIKSGMTTEKALFVSARSEFGGFAEELKTAGRKILAGEKTTQALSEISTTIRSPVLERTLKLLVEGIKNGAQIADLLLQLGNDLREENALQKEIQANISMYVGMIFITSALGAPILFGISTVIVGTVSEQLMATSGTLSSLKDMPSGNLGPLSGLSSFVGASRTQISPDFIQLFSLIALIVTAFSASFTIGIIQNGKEKAGIKLIPMILIVAIVLFFIVKNTLASMIGGVGGLF